ncbi:hypothetical protein, partial [Kribbia dieselivorans]|uniref:hypothetical protein n=1 Tax=Kribbia dieselivorans TaxID=331526 RepID=UPI001C3F496E
APAVVVAALLAGVALSWLASRVVGPAPGEGWRWVPVALGAVVAGSLVVTAVPDGRALIREGYQPVAFPAEFSEARRALTGAEAVVSLPWQPLRRTDWASGAQFLDPTPRAVSAAVLVDDALVVRRSGGEFVVTDHPMDPTWTAALRRGEIPQALIAARGVTHVLVWRGSPGAPDGPPPGWCESWRGDDFAVWVRG